MKYSIDELSSTKFSDMLNWGKCDRKKDFAYFSITEYPLPWTVYPNIFENIKKIFKEFYRNIFQDFSYV